MLSLLQAALFSHAFGLYVVALTGAFGWSKTAVSTGYALVQLEGGLLGPVQGWLLERFGPRRVIAVGVVLLGAGMVWLGRVESLAGFYAAMLVAGVGVAFAGFLSVTTATVPWFRRRRARALAFTGIGMSVGGLLVPLVAASVVTLGWRGTLQASGLVMIAVGLPMALLMRGDPARYGQVPDGRAHGFPDRVAGGAELRPRDESTDHTLREALRTRAFWMLSVGHGSALLVVSAVVVHLIPHLSEGVGYSLEGAAGVMALLTAMTIFGQVLGGVIGDRFDKRRLAIVAMLAHALGLFALAWGPGAVAVLAFTALHGVAWGVRGPLMGALRADYFGASHFGSIMGASTLVIMVGQLLGPIIAGTLADQLGDYRLGFTVLATMAALASGSFALATPPGPPPRAGAGGGAHGPDPAGTAAP
jgi:MFS family permease